MIPERTYPQTEHAILRSISHEQRPDIAIEVYPLNKTPRVYLFDPKYKLRSEGDSEKSPQPKKEDLDKMHVYRDAIHDQQGNRVVKYAAILYPGIDHLYPDSGIAALSAYPEPEAVEQLREQLYKILLAAL